MTCIKKLPAGLLASLTLAVGMASAAAAADPIKLGFHAPLTGFAAADGNSARISAEIAVEQINAEGGIDGRMVELIVYDDQAAPKNAAPIATKIAEQDRADVAVSGSYSGPSRAAATIFQSAGIPYVVSYAVDPSITRAGDFVFRTFTVATVEGRAGAKLIKEDLNLERVSLVVLKNDFGQSLAEGFTQGAEKYGLDVTGRYEYGIQDRQFGPIVTKLKDDAAQAIYITGYFFTGGPLVKQIRAAGIDVPIIGQAGFDSDKFIEIAGDAAEGVIITTSLDRENTDPTNQAFLRAFEEKAGIRADMVGASAHAAVMVAANALRNAGTEDKKAIRDAIAATDMNTVIGHVRFNALGELVHDIQVQVVKDGEYRRRGVLSDSEFLAPPSE